MKVIGSTYIPFKGFSAINLFGIIFARKEFLPLSAGILNHEAIHSKQIKELLFVGFYIWYVVEWLIRLLYLRNPRKAYKAISFEKEAFENDTDYYYLKGRKRFAFIKYLK